MRIPHDRNFLPSKKEISLQQVKCCWRPLWLRSCLGHPIKIVQYRELRSKPMLPIRGYKKRGGYLQSPAPPRLFSPIPHSSFKYPMTSDSSSSFHLLLSHRKESSVTTSRSEDAWSLKELSAHLMMWEFYCFGILWLQNSLLCYWNSLLCYWIWKTNIILNQPLKRICTTSV